MNIFKGTHNLPSFENTVITIGSFDGVHRGHQKLISQINDLASEINGESLIITFDPHPRKVIFPKDKSLLLITSLDEKLALFESYGVDNVVVVPFSIEFSQQSPQEYVESFLLNLFNPRYIVIGYDHRFGLNRMGDLSFLKSYEVADKLEIIEVGKEALDEIAISSTKIRNAILEGNVTEANLFLNHEYHLVGKVVKGDQIGQTIGFPTANLSVIHPDKVIPAYGIYSVELVIDEVKYGGMLYIGDRPSINNEKKRVLEVNIFNFKQDIYGYEIDLYFVDYLRGDKKFDNLDKLKQQLTFDKKAALKSLSLRFSQSQAPKVTVAILNYNGESYLESYLPPMLESSIAPFDILLIDNASTDDSVSYVEQWHPEVHLRKLKKNYGFAGGYNKGMQAVQTKYTAIINSDVLVSQNWLDPIISKLEADPSIGAIQPKIKSLEEQSHFEYAGASGGFVDRLGYPFCRGRIMDTLEKDISQYDQAIDIAWASGACMVIRTDLYHKLKGFDADYFAHQEEIDLCYRIRAAGYRILCFPESVIFHLGGGTLAYESPRKTYLNFRNNINTLVKNESWLKLLWLIPLRFGLDLLAFIKFTIDGKRPNALSVFKAYVSIVGGFLSTLKKRHIYRKLVKANQINHPNKAGIYGGSIVLDYYLRGKKKYSEIIKTDP